jgi:hypothetical protein
MYTKKEITTSAGKNSHVNILNLMHLPNRVLGKCVMKNKIAKRISAHSGETFRRNYSLALANLQEIYDKV